MLSIWISTAEAFYRAYEQGVPLFAMRYEDLNEHRQAMLERFFDYTALSHERLEQALRGFERDAQASTFLERENGKGNQHKLDEEQVQTITDILVQHPRKLTPNVILPGTLVL